MKLAAGYILWCDLRLCESIIVFFFIQQGVCVQMSELENIICYYNVIV